MLMSSLLVASSVSFPSTTPADDEPGSPARSPLARRAPHLPFRRISLPAVPSQAAIAHARAAQSRHRFSVAATGSLPEEQQQQPQQQQPQPQQQAITSNINYVDPGHIPRQRRTTSRPSSLAVPRPPRPSASASGIEHKRTQVIREILGSERSYVDGLDLIYDLFLEPLIRSLDLPRPLLSRNQLNIVFSNFIEIWNFHKSFYAALYALLPPSFRSPTPPQPQPQQQRLSEPPPPGVADLLSQHFPYLNLYHPFVTAFPTLMATLDNFTSPLSASYSQPFADFIKLQQQDPRCRPFALRDWLLTLIQRCPRYELLLRDLILHTDSSDPEYQPLQNVLILVTKSVFLFTLPPFVIIN
jgi:FYVE/RhoGEF/PH domain-containing protein 5/6